MLRPRREHVKTTTMTKTFQKTYEISSLKAWNENETSKTADTRTLRQPL